MKANEVPEKIYLSYETDNEDYKEHIFIDYMWHKHPFDGLINIEYIQTNAFIEKAYEFISLNVTDYIDVTYKGGIEHLALQERFIEDFKKYMEL